MESVYLKKNMECYLHVRQWNTKQGNLQDHAALCQGLDCDYDAQEWVLSSYNFAVISLPADCRKNFVAFQQYVIRLQKKRTITSWAKYEMPRNRQCNFMMSNYTVYDNGAKSVAIKTLGYERRV